MEYGVQVAIKFVPKWNKEGAEHECNILNSLNVRGNPERFGIPAFFPLEEDTWNSFFLYATTKFDESLEEINKRLGYIHSMDSMILLRNFVSDTF